MQDSSNNYSNLKPLMKDTYSQAKPKSDKKFKRIKEMLSQSKNQGKK